MRRLLDRRGARLLLAILLPLFAVLTHGPGFSAQRLAGAAPAGLDKGVHALFGALFLALLVAARPAGARSWRGQLAAALALLGAGVAAGELLQPLTGRRADAADAAATLLGAGLASWVCLAARGPRWRPADTAWAARGLGILGALVMGVECLWPGHGPRPPGIEVFGVAIGSEALGLGAGLGALTWLAVVARPLGVARPLAGGAAALGLGAGLAWGAGWVGGVNGLAPAAWGGWGAALVLALITLAGAREGGGRGREAGGDGELGFVGAGVRVGGLTLLSRLTGLVRDAALAALFGLGAVADAFFVGFLVPNLARRLFGEGALASAFLPVYTHLLAEDRRAARRLATLTLGGLAVVLGGLTLLAEAAILGLLHRGGGGEGWSPETAMALEMTAWMLPYAPLVCLVALFGGLLQVHGRFGPAAAAPLLLNLGVVLAAALASPLAGRRAATVVAGAVVGAGLIQLAWMLTLALRQAPWLGGWQGTGAPLRRMLGTWGPMVLALAVYQLNALFDVLFAFLLAPRTGGPPALVLFGHAVAHPVETGAVAALQWAQRLYQFPLGVFGIALATAIFPALARAFARERDGGEAGPGEQAGFEAILVRGWRLAVFIGLPASAGLLLVSEPLVRLVYARGAFSHADVGRVAALLWGYGAGVWAYTLVHVSTRAFYARGEARVPLRVALAAVAVNFGLNGVLIWPLGAAGLAVSTAVSGTLQAGLLVFALARPGAAVWRAWGRSLLLTGLMAIVVGGLRAWLSPMARPASSSAALLALLVLAGAGVYALGAWRLGCPELRWLLGRRPPDEAPSPPV